MAEFYRATRIEELDRSHPGLLKFVEEQYAAKVTHTQIASMLKELYDEDVSVQAVSNHYRLRWWPKQEVQKTSWREARNQYHILKEEMAADPQCDSAKIIETLVTSGIVQQKELIAQADVVELIAEMRRREAAAGRMEIERAKLKLGYDELEVKKQEVENEKEALKLKVEQLQKAHERERGEVEKAVANAEKDPAKAVRDIRAIYGLSA